MGMATTLRSAEALADAGLLERDRLPALAQVAARYAVAITPALAELIDLADPADPIARQFLPSEAELIASPGELADPIGDAAHSPVAGVVRSLSRPRAAEGDPTLRGLLPFLLPPRDGGPRQGQGADARAARRGARLHRRPTRRSGR